MTDDTATTSHSSADRQPRSLFDPEILRPAIPASVIALVTRRESPDRPSQLGETVTDTLPGGLVVMSSITPGLGAGSVAQRRRLAPTQTPFFKVLVKGERLTPRPGRADDFSWPRTDADGGGDDMSPLRAQPARSYSRPLFIRLGSSVGRAED